MYRNYDNLRDLMIDQLIIIRGFITLLRNKNFFTSACNMPSHNRVQEELNKLGEANPCMVLLLTLKAARYSCNIREEFSERSCVRLMLSLIQKKLYLLSSCMQTTLYSVEYADTKNE